VRHVGGHAGRAPEFWLVFSDHALNLEQKIILRGAADRTVQENNFRARA
jgi:hypothetical protein